MRVRMVEAEGSARLAVAVGERYAIADPTRGPATVDALVQGGDAARAAVQRQLDAGDLPLLDAAAATAVAPCVPLPSKILCIRLNYRSHAEQAGMPLPDRPGVLVKLAGTLLPAGSPMPCPAVAREYDYEGELAVVIGRRAVDVDPVQALDHVWGYCNVNDVHARDLHPFHFGKNLAGSLPVGPDLVSADEVGDPADLTIRTWLNGELRQDSRTSDMLFGVGELISWASRYVALEAGDLIATGTPAGPIVHRADRVWMRPGDVVEVEVGPLGRLTTPLAAA